MICFAKDPMYLGCYVTAMRPIPQMLRAHAKALGWSHHSIIFNDMRNLWEISEY